MTNQIIKGLLMSINPALVAVNATTELSTIDFITKIIILIGAIASAFVAMRNVQEWFLKRFNKKNKEKQV